jgi:uncharacterized membrane protein
VIGLTPLGALHTAIGVVALVCGFWILARDREISLGNGLGVTYLLLTALTAGTGLFIFQRGGFGIPHALSVLTLLAIAAGALVENTRLLGPWSRYGQALCYSATVLFHLVPGFVETLTRIPPGSPVAKAPEDPVLQPILGTLLFLFLVGITLQFRWLRRQPAPAPVPVASR